MLSLLPVVEQKKMLIKRHTRRQKLRKSSRISRSPCRTRHRWFESVTVVSGKGLQAYSVVVGSFSLKANAEGLQSTLKQGGYDAQIAYNPQVNMYRVIASTSDDKASAVQSRDAIRGSKFNPKSDAWLLFKK